MKQPEATKVAKDLPLTRDPFLERILKSKIPEASEIQLILFQHCNLACHFCGQDHNDKTGIDTIVKKAEEILDFMRGNLRKLHFINVMGGEIFNDDLPDKIYDDYFRLCSHVQFEATQMDHQVRFNFASNLIFSKSDRVLRFFDRLTAQGISFCIGTSYDFAGRKNSLWDSQGFKSNLQLFKPHIRVVNMVLTKPSIQRLLANDDPVFKEIYSEFDIFFEYFQPERNSDLLMPSDEEILEAFIFLANNYPKCAPVSDMINNDSNQMTCYGMNSMTLLPSGEKTRCRYMEYKPDSFQNEVNYQSNSNITTAFLNENECLSCPWFQRCTLRCFVQADWQKREKSKECIMKGFFQQTVGKSLDSQKL